MSSRLYIQLSQETLIHGIPPIAIIQAALSWTRHYRFVLSSSYFTNNNTSSFLQRYHERMSDNVARIYARRVLELTAMSTATWISKTQLQEDMMIGKPTEWSTIDLDKQRREFGESISSLGKTKLQRLWAAASRIFNLTLLVSPLTILIPMSYVMGSTSTITEYTWDYSIWAIEKAGPTFMKLFQWATTRHDLFPAEFITHFTKLQDDTNGHSWEETQRILESVFGPNHTQLLDFDIKTHHNRIIAQKKQQDTVVPWKQFFFFSKTNLSKDPMYRPIGSGCIAQVYKAKLKQNTGLLPAGTEVAIKVIHPGILHKVCIDFYILNKITSWIEKIPGLNLDYLSIQDSVNQFRDVMLPQLDLRVEARNLHRFRRDFANDPQVSFPQPIDELTSRNVLVETFIHGIPIVDWIKDEKSTMNERQDIATIGLETVMKMIFLHDFVHGDLHPGNILIDRNINARGKPLRINLLDCGLVVEMGERDHQNLVKILGALVKKDGLLAAQYMVDTSKKCQASPREVELFKKGIQRIIDDDEDNNFLESVGDYLADICYMACKYKVKLESSFINAALACEIMEGIASKLYPDMKVQRIALPMVLKAEIMHGLKGMKFL